jgi:DNA-binding MarR family transcriptional regulator
MEKRKLVLIFSIITLASFLITISISLLEAIKREESGLQIPQEQFLFYRPRIPFFGFLLSSSLLVIAIFPLSYYFLSKKLEQKLEKNFNLILKLIKKNNSSLDKIPYKEIENKNIVLKFLNPSERKVIEALIEKNGKILQSEITRMKGMTKLKTHRAVRDLEKKGIITRESYGKTYRVILSEDVKGILLK